MKWRLRWIFSACCWAAATVALVVVLPVHAQGYTTVYQAKLAVVPRLAGTVVGGIDNAPVAGARVELRSPDWKTALKTTQTDANGKFSLGGDSNGKLVYIQISSPGFDPYQLRVRISQKSKSNLVIHLVVAT